MYSTETGERQFYEQADISEPGHCKPVETTDEDRQSSELKIFHDVAKALTSTLDLDTILQTIMEKMAAHFEPATWGFLLRDEARDELYYAAAVGDGCESINALRL